MRNLLVVLAFALVAGCGDDEEEAPIVDMAVPPDLSAPSDMVAQDGAGDAAPADGGTATCAMTLTCIQRCNSQNADTCIPACVAQLSPTAQPFYDDLQTCAQPACYTATDAGAPACADPSSTACSICVTTKCSSEATACLTH